MALVALAAFGVVAWWATGGTQSQKVPLPISTSSQEERALPPAAGVQTTSVDSIDSRLAVEGIPAIAADRRLTDDFYNSKDWRVFAERAKRSPSSGGYFYASRAVASCGDTKSILQSTMAPQAMTAVDTGHQSAQRARALRVLEDRCGSFVSDEVTVSSGSSLVQEGAKLGDPYASIALELTAALSSEKRSAVVKALENVFSTRDPELIYYSASRLVSGKALGSAELIDGVKYEAEVVRLAWAQTYCNLGGNCGPYNEVILRECAFYSACPQSMDELLRHRANEAGLDEKQWNSSQQLADFLSDAVNSGSAEKVFGVRSVQ